MPATEVPRKGHPDKLADGIADALLAALLARTPETRAGIEVLLSGNRVVIAGEVSSIELDLEAWAADVIRDYCATVSYAHGRAFIPQDIDCSLQMQSSDCAKTVLRGHWGDQCIVFGYAHALTPTGLPPRQHLARKMQRFLDDPSTRYEFGLLSDGKLLVSLPVAGREGDLVRCELNIQLDDDSKTAVHSIEEATALLIAAEVSKMQDVGLDLELSCNPRVEVVVNPGGSFRQGGPAGDSGLTGRKVIADLYGCELRSGGGALSGKDFTKVDRSGSYLAREWAIAIVKAGLAPECEVQLSFGRDSSGPLSIEVVGVSPEVAPLVVNVLVEAAESGVATTIKRYQAASSMLVDLAASGHVGRDDLPLAWESPDKELVERLTALC